MRRVVFLDESGANLAMGRSLARGGASGHEWVEPRPRNWGDNLTLVGAMRVDRWLTLSTAWGRHDHASVCRVGAHRLVPRLRRGDIVGLDNLAAHKTGRVCTLVEQAGATLHLLPSFRLIEAAWVLIKKRIRVVAPRTSAALRTTAQRAERPRPPNPSG